MPSGALPADAQILDSDSDAERRRKLAGIRTAANVTKPPESSEKISSCSRASPTRCTHVCPQQTFAEVEVISDEAHCSKRVRWRVELICHSDESGFRLHQSIRMKSKAVAVFPLSVPTAEHCSVSLPHPVHPHLGARFAHTRCKRTSR